MTVQTVDSPHSKGRLLALAFGSVGVVYGDIGTSPLYAFKESLAAATQHHTVAANEHMVLGVLSLVLWALFIIVTLKYVVLLLRADNNGEGGILSLMALAQRALGARKSGWVILLGMAGAALFYGDALITPAISVLSAVEGLELVTTAFKPWVIILAMLIMILLFAMQRRGTAQLSNLFGVIMLIWFAALAWGGIIHLADTPAVWKAFNPYHAYYFLTHYGMASVIALGAVFLAVTGAEALYADLGHFGKKPIQYAWIFFVMPSLMLNYIGQAALVLENPETAQNSFYLLYPEWALLPMVLLATFATVIASQAVISGAYSLTQQAIHLGLLPRLHIDYTSEKQAGQIYMPQVNWLLLLGVLFLIELFRTSSALASAYGIAVTGTMVITAILAFVVMRHVWKWNRVISLLVVTPLLLIDLIFLGANLTKFMQGGFMPVLISAFLVMLMMTWLRGNRLLHAQEHDHLQFMPALIEELAKHPPVRIEGTAIYLTSNAEHAPSALSQNLKHNKVLHSHNILLTLHFTDKPFVRDEERVTHDSLCGDFTRMHMYFGYMESPNVTRGLRMLRESGGIKIDMMQTSFFISRRNILPSANFGMPLWQDYIYKALANNATDAAEYFHLPMSRVVELGVQLRV